MSKTIVDKNMLTWEVYPSGGADRSHIVFNCLSNRMLRPRFVVASGDEADAERAVLEASNDQLQEMLSRSTEVS